MSDSDEKKYGFNPLDARDALLDADGDGVSNLDEITAGTDPTDSASHPLTQREKGLLTILINRNNQLNQERLKNKYIPKLRIPTILMIKKLKN